MENIEYCNLERVVAQSHVNKDPTGWLGNLERLKKEKAEIDLLFFKLFFLSIVLPLTKVIPHKRNMYLLIQVMAGHLISSSSLLNITHQAFDLYLYRRP